MPCSATAEGAAGSVVAADESVVADFFHATNSLTVERKHSDYSADGKASLMLTPENHSPGS